MDEQQRVASIADWYLTDQLDFDKQLIRLRFETLRPHLKGSDGLELGPADGQMTQLLLNHFAHLTVVDGSSELLACIPESASLIKVQSLFEQYAPHGAFTTIVMEHVLEHVDRPIDLLKRARSWLAPGGRILAGVPNGHSIDRLVAVKMGLLSEPCELNARDRTLGIAGCIRPTASERTSKRQASASSRAAACFSNHSRISRSRAIGPKR